MYVGPAGLRRPDPGTGAPVRVDRLLLRGVERMGAAPDE